MTTTRPTLSAPSRTIAILLLILCLTGAAAAEKPTREIDVALGGTRVLAFRRQVDKISIGDHRIVDVKSIGSRWLQLSGKSLGETTVIVIDNSGRLTRMLVTVNIPIEGLAAKLRSVFPGEHIALRAVGSTVILSGTVSDPVISERATKLVKEFVAHSKEGAQVHNFLSMKGRQQVQIRVKVAEVSRTALRELGVNVWHRQNKTAAGLLSPGTTLGQGLAPSLGTTGASLQPGGSLKAVEEGGTLPLPVIAAPMTGAFGLHLSTHASSVVPISVALNLLQGKGLAKILSEPTLVAYSGQNASFLAGGEFPVPIPQGLGQTSIEFKKYGVSLDFTPTVLGDSSVHLKVAVSVSEKDQAGGVALQGVAVPGLTTRRSETTVRMKNGQSFAIAGLLHDRITSSSSKVPLLGDIPILGMLFRQNTFNRVEQELVILVQANLVRPLKPGEVPPLPGEDEVADPGAVAFFLLGSIDPQLKGKKRSKPVGPMGVTK
jgi:pilus assembly protein CpaC